MPAFKSLERSAAVALLLSLVGCGAGDNVPAPQAAVPTLTLTANPDSVLAGASSMLSWSSSNATSCTASGAWSGDRATGGSLAVTPAATSAYSLTCSGTGGSATGSASVNVVVPPPPAPTPTVNLVANPGSITAGASSTLTWTSSDSTACTASGAWSGAQALQGSATVSPAATSTYTLNCTGAGGSAMNSTSVTVTAAPPPPAPTPTLNLTASPGSITSGGSSTLTWSSANASTCTTSGAWSGSRAVNGSLIVAPASTATYSMSCSGSGGSASSSVTVTVVAPPAVTLTLSASPASVASGSSSTLSWAAANATTCTASDGWSGAKATSGNASTGALTAATTFTLSCTGAGGSVSRSVTVALVASGAPTAQSASREGQFTVANYTSGIASGTYYTAQKIWYPTNGNPPYPGVVFVPGLNGSYADTESVVINGQTIEEVNIIQWARFLASHGFAVLFIDMKNQGESPATRATALLDAANALAAENTRAGSPLNGKVQTQNMAVTGFSFGGAGALIAANLNSNSRIKAALALSPIPSGQSTYPAMSVPTLIMGGQNDPFSSGTGFLSQYNSIPATTKKVLVEVKDSGQFQSMHAVAIVPLGAHSSDPVVARIGLSFLQVYLAGDLRYDQFLVTDPLLNRFQRVP